MFGIFRIKKSISSFPFRNSGIYLFNEIFLRGINLAYLPILTLYLLPSEFGILSTLTSCITFFVFIIGLNMNNYVTIQFSKIEKNKESLIHTEYFNSLFTILLIFVILLLIVSLFDFHFLHSIFQNNENMMLIVAISFFEVLVSYKIMSSIIRDEPNVVMKITLYKNIIDFIFTFGMLLFFHLSYQSRIYGLLISGLLSMIFFLNEFKNLSFNISNNIRKSFQFIGGSISLIPHELSIWIRGGLDRILILGIVGASFSGVYSLSFQLALILAVVSSAINNSLIPKIYRYEGIKRFSTNYFSYFKVFTSIVLCVFIGMFFILPLLTPYFISDKYDGFVFYYRILLIGFLFKSFYYYFVNPILYRGKTFNVSKISMIVSCTHFLLLFMVLKNGGLLAATLIFCFSELFMLSIVIIQGLRIVKGMDEGVINK